MSLTLLNGKTSQMIEILTVRWELKTTMKPFRTIVESTDIHRHLVTCKGVCLRSTILLGIRRQR